MPAWTAIYLAAFWVVLPCVCILSWLYGDRPLKYATSSYGILILAGRLGWAARDHATVETSEMLADAVLLACMTALALRYRRWWLTVAAALQLLACLGHLEAVQGGISRLGYALLVNIGAYPILMTLIVPLVGRIAGVCQWKSRHVFGLRGDTPKR